MKSGGPLLHVYAVSHRSEGSHFSSEQSDKVQQFSGLSFKWLPLNAALKEDTSLKNITIQWKQKIVSKGLLGKKNFI